MIYKSGYDKAELIRRWDDITSPARFAGANETLDWIYNASRKDDRVRLVKKPRAAYDPYATVFRGRIKEEENGSAIRGVFTKGLADYIITFAVFGIYFGVCAEYASRAADKTLPLMMISVGIAAVLFLLIPLPGKRRKYGELIKKVTGEKDFAPAPAEKPAEKKEKYKFRLSGKR